ncbi:RagB/SusD family nutrient uptake outer membrane protein [Fibrivirga algicola]|uniref:RagB/SusD family nutrient uptake outer membrane protein n=1 Tax=Fibrivirga algicola TaxID=2950420 RepID=A0ABX0QJW7_9BACT|nr:RagB/SusD family nutrient uptake outer membrane protein [Fibrivirga algicola]NID11143.1 RagB/SusD family nutrient uptake outer membrane protein [Fibrivirga algicola]
MFKPYKLVLTGSLVLLGASSCSDLLVTEPKQSISSAVALTDITGLRSLLISVYDRLQPATYYGQRMMIAPEIMADNVRLANQNSNRYFNERVNAPNAHMQQYWDNYGGINEANFILSGIDGANTTGVEKTQIKGEALFLRALLYFDMARVFAYEPKKIVNGFDKGLILRTTPTDDASKATFEARATVEQTYQQIEKDLKDAIELLPAMAAATNRQRANKAAAQGLLSRLYLYWEKYPECIQLATDAMASPAARLVTGAQYAAAFTASPNPESLFEINYVQATESLGSNESLHSLTNPPSVTTGNWGDVVFTTELLNLYDAADARRAAFYASTKSGEAVTFSRKYSGARGAFTDNVPVMRYSELLLIRAEAYAASGDNVKAQADLNTLRARAGVTPVAATVTGQALIDAILTERRLELVLEGHRFFDLKRRGLTITKASLSAVVPYTDYRILAPIPTAQVQLNTKLQQNPGY